MKLSRKVGSTSQIFQIFIQDSSSTTGAGLTGLTNATSNLVAYYHRDTDTTATAISLVSMTVGTFTSSGFKEIDSTNMPGWYQFCPPNAAFNSGAASVGFHLKGASNMAPLPIEVDLDSQVDVTFWNGTVVATPATAGIPDVNIKNMNNVAATSITTVNANVGTTQPINFTGTAGSALAKSDMVDVAGAAVSATTAQLGVNVVNWDNTVVATPATAGIPDVNTKNINNVAAATPGASGGVLISGTNSGTTTLGALTVTGATTHTGNVVLSDGLTISAPSTTNRAGFSIAGNGTGAGMSVTGGATGIGLSVVGGGTSGDGVKVVTTSGHGVNLAPVGTSMHGLLSTGGNGGTSDGIKAVAGTGGVDIRGNITGNLVGTVSTLTTYTGNTPQTGDVYALANGANGFANIKTDTAAIKTQTDKLAFTVANKVDANVYTWNGTAVATPATAGVPEVDVKAINNVATTPVTTVKAVQGLTTADTVTTVSGNVSGNVTGSVGSVVAAVTTTQVVRANTAAAGGATTITLDAAASAVNSFYVNDLIVITGGTGVGQARFITAYVGATQVATVATWATNPNNTSTFAIYGFDAVAGATAPTAAQNATAIWQDLLAGSDFGTASSIGALLKADIDATISSRTKPADTQARVTLVDTLTTYTGNTPQTGDVYALANGGSGFVAVKGDTAAIKVQTDKLVFTSAGRVDANIEAIHNVTAAATDLERGVIGNVICTVGSASTTTSIVTSSMDPAAAVTDQFKGRILTFDRSTTTVNLRGQATDITGNTSLGVLTVTALTDAPVSGDTFTIT